MSAAGARNGQLTKPPGPLGRLETLAVWMAAPRKVRLVAGMAKRRSAAQAAG